MRTAKLILILVLVLALAVLILQNREPVDTHFLFFTLEMPQILLLLLTAAGGFVLGILVSLYTRRQRGKRPNERTSVAPRDESW